MISEIASIALTAAETATLVSSGIGIQCQVAVKLEVVDVGIY